MDANEYVLSAVIFFLTYTMSLASSAIMELFVDEGRHGIFFQYVSEKVIILLKSKLERVHRLIWGIILFSVLIYHLIVTLYFFQIEINDFVFYPIVIIVFLWMILSYVKVYLRDLDKIFILDRENQIVKINNKPIKLSMVSCILIKPSLVLMKTSIFSHLIFLKTKDGKKYI